MPHQQQVKKTHPNLPPPPNIQEEEIYKQNALRSHPNLPPPPPLQTVEPVQPVASPLSAEAPPITFDEDKFATNMEEIANATVNNLKKFYKTDDVEVRIAHQGGRRDLKEQAELANRGASDTTISLHNFSAATDFDIFINGEWMRGEGKDNSLAQSPDPFRVLGSEALKRGYFWGWGGDAKHVGETRFVSDFIEKYPDYAFKDNTKAVYEKYSETAPAGYKPLLEKLDELYGKSEVKREYTGKERTIDPLLDAIYVDAVSESQEKSEVDIALADETKRVKDSPNAPIDDYDNITKPRSEVVISNVNYDRMADAPPPVTDGELYDLAVQNTSYQNIIENILNPAPYMYAGDGAIAEEIDSQPGAKMTTPFIMRLTDEMKAYYNRENYDPSAQDVLTVSNNIIHNIPELAVGMAEFHADLFNDVTQAWGATADKMVLDAGSPHDDWGEVGQDVMDAIDFFNVSFTDVVEALATPVVLPFYKLAGMSDESVERIKQASTEARGRFLHSPLNPIAAAYGMKGGLKGLSKGETKGGPKLRAFIKEQAENGRVALEYYRNPAKFDQMPNPSVVEITNTLKVMEPAQISNFEKGLVQLEFDLTKVPPLEEVSKARAKKAMDKAEAERQQTLGLKDVAEVTRKKTIPKEQKEAFGEDVPSDAVVYVEPPPNPKFDPLFNHLIVQKPIVTPFAETPLLEQPKPRYVSQNSREAVVIKNDYGNLLENLKELDRKIDGLKKGGEPKLDRVVSLEKVPKAIMDSMYNDRLVNLKKARDNVQKNIELKLKEMEKLGIDPLNYMNMAFGLPPGSGVARWLLERIKKGLPIPEGKLREMLSGSKRTPESYKGDNPYYNSNVQKMQDIYNKQDGSMDAKAIQKLRTFKEKMMEGFPDANYRIRKGLFDEFGNIPEVREALNYMDRLRGSSGITLTQLEQGKYQVTRGLKNNEKRIFNRLSQAINEVEIWNNHQTRIAELVKKLDKTSGKDRVPIQNEIRRLNKYRLSNSFDPVTGKEIPMHQAANRYADYARATIYQYPSIYHRVMKGFDLYKEALKERFDEGLIGEADYNNLSQRLYNPKQYLEKLRDSNTIGVGPARSITVPKTDVKKMGTGSSGHLFNDWEAMYHQSLSSKNNIIHKNRANNALYDLAETMGAEIGDIIYIPEGGAKLPDGYKSVELMRKDLEGNVSKKRVAMREEFLDSWVSKGENAIKSSTANALGWATLTKPLKASATGYNWGFALYQMPLDAGYNIMHGRAFSSFVPLAVPQLLRDYIATAPDVMTRNWKHGKYGKRNFGANPANEVRKYYLEGGRMDYFTAMGQFGRTRTGGLKKGQSPFMGWINDWAGALGSTTELWTRMAIRNRYMRPKSKIGTLGGANMSSIDASLGARNTLDFLAGGGIAKAMDSGLPYFNAGIQASRGMFRSLGFGAERGTSPYFSSRGKTLAKYAQVMGIAGAMAWYNRTQEPENYFKLSDTERYNNWVIPISDMVIHDKESGRDIPMYLRFAKDQGQRAVAGLIDVGMAIAMKDEKSLDVISKYLDRTLENVSPITVSMLPPALKIIAGWKSNKDIFYNAEIWKGDYTVENPYRVNPETGEFAQDVAGVWNSFANGESYTLDPTQLDFAFKQLGSQSQPVFELFGTLHKNIKEMAGMELKDMRHPVTVSDVPGFNNVVRRIVREVPIDRVDNRMRPITKELISKTETHKEINNQMQDRFFFVMQEAQKKGNVEKADSTYKKYEEWLQKQGDSMGLAEYERLEKNGNQKQLWKQAGDLRGIPQIASYFLKNYRTKGPREKAMALYGEFANPYFVANPEAYSPFIEAIEEYSGFMSEETQGMLNLFINNDEADLRKIYGNDLYERFINLHDKKLRESKNKLAK